MNDTVDTFVHFAGERLDSHISELSAAYNRNPLSVEQINEAYKAHRELFSRELNEMIAKLIIPGSPWIEARLQSIKETYEAKLTLQENEAAVNQKIRDFL